MIGIVDDALLIKEGVARGRCWVERRIHDLGSGGAESEARGGEIVERDGNRAVGLTPACGAYNWVLAARTVASER